MCRALVQLAVSEGAGDPVEGPQFWVHLAASTPLIGGRIVIDIDGVCLLSVCARDGHRNVLLVRKPVGADIGGVQWDSFPGESRSKVLLLRRNLLPSAFLAHFIPMTHLGDILGGALPVRPV